jgi:putative two-component system response regulator
MTRKGNLLVVDDTPASLKLLTELLHAEGYAVRSAISGELALRAALQDPPELILLDIKMPELDGFEVCRRLKAQPATQDVPIIFVSALSETTEKVIGFELGAVDFVTKPYQREELLMRVRTHLEITRLRNRLEQLVEERTRALRNSMLAFITAMAATVEIRDPYTAGHQRRVADLATTIARAMHLPDHQIEGLNWSAVLHDIGKIRTPTEILCKPGRLSKLEFGLIKQHPEIGYEILKAIDFPWPIAQIVLQHHERLDGSGYPQGLTAPDILLEAKILSVADVMEAMISHRPYRAGLGLAAALSEITQRSGLLYDPAVVDACVTLFNTQHYSLPA